MPDEKMYLKHVHILEKVVNICIINDLSYPPANNQNAFFYYPTRRLSTVPMDITAIRASLLRRYQQDHWVVGCQFEGTNGLKFVCVDCVRMIL